MYANSKAGITTQISFNLDPLSKARLAWIKARYSGLKPSGSLILRRALSHYLKHLDQINDDPEQQQEEVYHLKAQSSGNSVPWERLPDFASHKGRKLSQWLTQAHRADMNRLMSEPFRTNQEGNQR
jgi:hypothetical protein